MDSGCASADDLADLILREQGQMTVPRLHSLLFYCRAWGLVWGGVRLFDNPVLAGRDGPVIQGLDVNGLEASVSCRPGLLTDCMPVIDAVLDSYGHLDDAGLQGLIRSESPWLEAYENGCSTVIAEDAMRAYYSRLMDADYPVREAHHAPHFPVRPVVTIGAEDFDRPTSLL